MAVTAAVVTAAVAVGGTAYSISSAESAKKEAKAKSEDMQREQGRLEGEARKKAYDEDSLAAESATQKSARARQRAMSASSKPSILNGGSSFSSASTASKTLLGS